MSQAERAYHDEEIQLWCQCARFRRQLTIITSKYTLRKMRVKEKQRRERLNQIKLLRLINQK